MADILTRLALASAAALLAAWAVLANLAPGGNYTMQFVDLHAYPVLEGAMP